MHHYNRNLNNQKALKKTTNLYWSVSMSQSWIFRIESVSLLVGYTFHMISIPTHDVNLLTFFFPWPSRPHPDTFLILFFRPFASLGVIKRLASFKRPHSFCGRTKAFFSVYFIFLRFQNFYRIMNDLHRFMILCERWWP